MSYQDRIDVFKSFTLELAGLSKCMERGVAAIITDGELSQVYSIGTNGGPKGQVDCLCVTEGKHGCVHAEINALVKCGTFNRGKVMFVTIAPCKQCATAIVNAPGGFSYVYFFEHWIRPSTGQIDETGVSILRNAGIKALKV
jgi:deoxycytidylate deaminase